VKLVLKHLSVVAVALLATGCTSSDNNKNISKDESSHPLIKNAKESGLIAIPSSREEQIKLVDDPKNPITEKKVELGKKLFFDPRLSKSNLISCNTCHNLATGGVDGVSAAIGHGWTANPHHLNSPTVYNAVFATRQFWDGRDPDLEKQAQGPILAGPEMASTKEIVVNTVKSIPAYVEEFKNAYGGNVEIDYETITKTIGNFERTLVTPSKFDKFLEGDASILNDAEKEGLKTFIDKGCATCHTGIALGGTMQPFPAIPNRPYRYADIGDFKGDSNGLVKVPTLRNIDETAPYFHNGAVWNLAEAVKIMGETQLGVDLKDDEINKIVTFLHTLNGEKPEVEYPQLPASTHTTPKPKVN
jgi:cytochrome c peroxidase